MGRSDEELPKKSNAIVNSSSKIAKHSDRFDIEPREHITGIAYRAAPTSKQKQESRNNIETSPHQNRGFFDTDTESIGDTTTDASVIHGEQQQQKSRREIPPIQAVAARQLNNEGFALTADQRVNVQELQRQYPQDFHNDEQALNALNSGRVLQGVDGQFFYNDELASYPTTTSGRWEENEGMENVEWHENQDQDQDQERNSELRADEETQRLDHHPQVSAFHIRPQKSPARNQMIPAYSEVDLKRGSGAVSAPHDIYQQVQQQAGAPPRFMQRETRPRTPQPPAKTADQLTPQSTPYKEQFRFNEPSSPAHGHYDQIHPKASKGDYVELDFDPPDLFAKNFKDLKRMAFDEDPHAPDHVLSESDQAKSLSERLALVRKLEPDQQTAFFAGLGIDNWEDAGDWFVAQFSQTLQRLKDARREKRKLAIALENEIDKRHDVVDQRRTVVDDALKDMRMSGAAVLQGTPNKNARG